MSPLFDRRGIPAHTYECVVDHDIEHTLPAHKLPEISPHWLATLLEWSSAATKCIC